MLLLISIIFSYESRDLIVENNIERWYSMKEICDHLGVSRDTIMTWIEKYDLPATQIGRLWKFKVSEVDNWMKSKQQNQ